MNKSSVSDVLARLQHFFEVDSDSALASAMNVNRQTLGSWRSRGRVPYEECINLAMQQQLSLDWLLIGEGQMHRKPTDATLTTKTKQDGALLSLLHDLSEGDRLEIQLVVQNKKRLRDMEQQLEQLTSELAAFGQPQTVPTEN